MAMDATETASGQPQQQQPKVETVKLPNRLFPLEYGKAFSQWWAGITPAAAEASVLSFVPFYSNSLKPAVGAEADKPDHTSPPLESSDDRVCASTQVHLSNQKHYLNEFSVTRPASETKHNLVILHGYGAGLGFFYKNFDALSKRAGWSLYALDLLGMGRSARPHFKIHAHDRIDKVREAESFFVDSLEDWRKQRGLEKFTLMGHSLGGYLAVCYALKYPQRLEKLVLVSPVGIPEDPWAVQAQMPDQESPMQAATHEAETAAAANVGTGEHAPASPPPTRRKYPGWFTYLWDANISPFSLVRWGGPLGPRLVSGWTSRRFSMLPEAESEALHMYSYTLFKQKGSGEYALSYLLAPGAFARDPLINRIPKIDRSLEIVFMYGDHDWMDAKTGRVVSETLRKDGRESKFKVISNAGHHLYLDNYDEFNEYVDGVLRETERK
ncbi:hypothetical protein TWF694_011781 [Orbilia ellipsospora]|uniref:AB hydrolase-1 domain-containing protein n=1 Tax=Orbilia ellipsospora TaxID=2528407 RepID=A0AAV9X6J9_9PEZI